MSVAAAGGLGGPFVALDAANCAEVRGTGRAFFRQKICLRPNMWTRSVQAQILAELTHATSRNAPQRNGTEQLVIFLIIMRA